MSFHSASFLLPFFFLAVALTPGSWLPAFGVELGCAIGCASGMYCARTVDPEKYGSSCYKVLLGGVLACQELRVWAAKKGSPNSDTDTIFEMLNSARMQRYGLIPGASPAIEPMQSIHASCCVNPSRYGGLHAFQHFSGVGCDSRKSTPSLSRTWYRLALEAAEFLSLRPV